MISLYNSDSFMGALPPPESVGVSAIFRGKISIDGERIAKCYIKPLPDVIAKEEGLSANMEIVSEALGYTLAKHANYRVPESAGIIELGAELLPPSVLEDLKSQTPGVDAQDKYIAWFSEDLAYPSLLKKEILGAPAHLQNLQILHLLKRLAKHADTASIVTFDEWTENSDRNLGNLIELRDGKLALIDHGRLFRYPTWNAEFLGEKSGLGCINRLSHCIDAVESQWSERTRTRSARGMAYNSLAAYWKNGGQEAAAEILDIFLAPEQREAVITFLAEALEPAEYSAKIGLLA